MHGIWKSAIVVLIAVLAAPTARGEGWKMPSLNPFKKRDSHPAHLHVSDKPSSAWWKPKLPSFASSKPRSSSRQPSTWSKMTSGTKSAWNKTKDALNPFDDEPAPQRSVTGYNTAFTQASARKKEEKKSTWWPSWGSKEKPQEPRTVQDFLSQKRPE